MLKWLKDFQILKTDTDMRRVRQLFCCYSQDTESNIPFIPEENTHLDLLDKNRKVHKHSLYFIYQYVYLPLNFYQKKRNKDMRNLIIHILKY